VQGEINQSLVDRLTPQIIALKNLSFEPITVYIDSNGGSVPLMETLLQLLTASDQDLNPSGSLVTVLTSRAGSAAADLLSYGDYALAYPGTAILYHGTRISHQVPLTTELTSLLGQYLREANNKYATKLAREIVDRFMFRFVTSKDHFDDIRLNDPTKVTELDCFLAYVSGQMSEGAKRILANAQARYGRYNDLLNFVVKKAGKKRLETFLQIEAHQIHSIVEFEVQQAKKKKVTNWSYEKGGLNTLIDDFFILNEYLDNIASGFFDRLCLKYGRWWLSDEENKELNGLPVEERQSRKIEKVQPLLLPIWSFFVALCNALQYGENELTAKDAVWLGLIDEILGEKNLPCRRMAWEYSDDEENEEDKEEQGGSNLASTATGA
jgi:hypothetical protein